MEDFSLDASYDAIVCLFSSIGYLPDADALRRTMHTFSDHLAPGGVVVEPWLSAQQLGAFQSSQLVCADGLEIARIAPPRGRRQADLVLHYLAGGPDDVRYFVEEHRMSLFSNEDYRDAFEHAGLECVFDPVGLSSRRGLYVCRQRTAHERRRDGLARRNGSQRLGRLFARSACFPSLERDESCDFLVIGRATQACRRRARCGWTSPAPASSCWRPCASGKGAAGQCRLHDRRHPRPGLRRLRR